MQWPRFIEAREIGGTATRLPPLPQPNAGVLVLDELLTVSALPGGLLAHVEGRIHYLDLGGIQAVSLDDFGAPPELWAGITKLYASGCGLRSLGDAARHLAPSVRFLYLDGCQLPEAELRRLLDLVPPGRLEALDVSGNPGCTPGLLAYLQQQRQQRATGPLSPGAFLNGKRVLLGPATVPARPVAAADASTTRNEAE